MVAHQHAQAELQTGSSLLVSSFRFCCLLLLVCVCRLLLVLLHGACWSWFPRVQDEPNRYFARADAQGRFAIRGVPPGRYVLIGWGLRAGEQRQTIAVPPEGLHNVAIALAGAATRETPAEPRDPVSRDPGVARGLGVKRERLNLPVIQDLHSAPTSQPR